MAEVQEMKISFDEIVHGRDASVRVSQDGLIYAVDLVVVITGYDRNYSAKILRTLKPEVFDNKKIILRPVSGGKPISLILFQNAIELVMVLPSQHAKEIRTQFANIITRYFAGDQSLGQEIAQNAQSIASVNMMARAALSPTDIEEDALIQRKRVRLELEERETELEIKKLELKKKSFEYELEFKQKSWQLQKTLMDTCATLSSNGVLDTRTKLHFKDNIMNLSGADIKSITNGDAPLTISTVAADLGIHLSTGDLIKAGKSLKQLYFNKYGEDPPKHDQFVGGAVRHVCSYTERDRDLVESVIRKMK
jgi:hypothetical protein